MPHVHVQHYPKDNLTPERLKAFDEAVTAAVTETFGVTGDKVSIALETVAPELWYDQVVTAFAARRELLIKAPGYWKEA
ncbi:tautomerase family protein [Streptomyces antimicrobicus]|uniref:Tautomerase family protein n=1 Tax=Streptomyces antimicrobicus TaxID=2883108 RepID=A0ABS8B2X9_9ACTN|nr:tautomerase family protein [Streptomyces antimicrobicus]MCB5178957.1 tautomerase family protein [Streptomyces antimicrobicus]